MNSALKDSLLVLRFGEAESLSSVRRAAEILHEEELPVIIYEFGSKKKGATEASAGLLTLRSPERWIRFIPPMFHQRCLLFFNLLRLSLIFWRGDRPKLIVAHGLVEQYVAWRLNDWFQVPYVVHVHDVYDRKELSYFHRKLFTLEKEVLAKAAFLIFSEMEREQIYRSRYGYTVPSFFVFNCPRLVPQLKSHFSIKEHLKLPSDQSILIYLGGDDKLNALEEGIKSLAYLPNVHFVIAGSVQIKSITALSPLIRKLRLRDRIHTVSLGPEARWDWLAASDLSYCVYRPTELRSIHLATACGKMMDSMAMGVPVVTSSEPTFHHFLEKFPVGLPVKRIDEFHISDAIGKLARNPPLQRQLGKTGRELHLKFFNLEYQSRKILPEFKFFYGNHEQWASPFRSAGVSRTPHWTTVPLTSGD